VVLAVYDVTSSSSFEEMKHWIEEVKTNANKNVRIIIVGNKIDLVDAENKSS
jgi:GTPase SAR1 family protein